MNNVTEEYIRTLARHLQEGDKHKDKVSMIKASDMVVVLEELLIMEGKEL